MIRKVMVLLVVACTVQLARSEKTVTDFLAALRQETDMQREVTDSKSVADDDILLDLYEESETMRVDSIEVIDLIKVSGPAKKRISDAMRKLDDPAFEVATDVREEGSLLRVLLRKEQGEAREIVALIAGADDCAVIRMQGVFAETAEMLGKLFLPLVSLRMREMGVPAE